jgi:phage terminase small subunit
MAKDLTAKQKIFVLEYLKDLNGTQAAIRAGYSAKTANVISSEMLTKPYIKAAIEDGMTKRAQKLEISADYVLEGIKRVTGDAEERGKHSDALRGFELMGKHLKLFTDKQELTGANGAPLIPQPVYKVVKV